jgi:endonuclease YncB( thermonuclease family)
MAIPSIPAEVQLVYRHAYALLFATLFASAALADQMVGKVVKIQDGDTLTVLTSDKQEHRIRLAGIDAPERNQPFGTRARQTLASLAFGKNVVVEFGKRDRYGRTIGKVLVNDRDINLEQVRHGLAWHYKFYQREQSPEDRNAYASAELEARSKHLGLWTHTNPVPPWEWRLRKKQ